MVVGLLIISTVNEMSTMRCGDSGIWRKEIHRRSGNVPQQEFDKILKSLESKKLVKQVSSVQVCVKTLSPYVRVFEERFYQLFVSN